MDKKDVLRIKVMLYKLANYFMRKSQNYRTKRMALQHFEHMPGTHGYYKLTLMLELEVTYLNIAYVIISAARV